MILCVDFDGTLVKHRYPDIGNPIPGAFEALKKFKAMGVTLILWTMRSNGKDGPMLDQAMEFCRRQGVEFDAVNDNPQPLSWTDSRKVYAHLYIDDAAVGCPLLVAEGERPWADWRFIEGRVLQEISRRNDEKKQQGKTESSRSVEGESKPVPARRDNEPQEACPSSLQDAIGELNYWKAATAYLADCHAATAIHAAMVKKTTKSARERYRSICEKARAILEKRYTGPLWSEPNRVIERCSHAEEALKEGKP
jgi:hypothetical protein